MHSPGCRPALCSRRLAVAADLETEAGLREAVGNPASTQDPLRLCALASSALHLKKVLRQLGSPCKGRTR